VTDRATRHWVVLADHAHARIYEVSGDIPLHRIAHLENPDARKAARDLGSDRPGRRSDALGNRHALGADEDPKEHSRNDFAREVAAYLNAARRQGRFDSLVLAMPPRALGLVRQALDVDSARLVEREIHKDLMHHTEEQLEALIGAVAADH
jgi:protein required for attachment to host cells